MTHRFSPDFYLPEFDLYIEITTLNQKLVTKKNRKVRRLQELYPDVKCKILYQRDYVNLLLKYGLEDESDAAKRHAQQTRAGDEPPLLGPALAG